MIVFGAGKLTEIGGALGKANEKVFFYFFSIFLEYDAGNLW